MWYKDLINSENDGLVWLLDLFDSEEAFTTHFIKSIKFFTKEAVLLQAEELKLSIEKQHKLPVRYSQKSKEHFHYLNNNTQSGTSTKGFKNRKEATRFSLKNALIHTKTKIHVRVDKDGNYAVRESISKALNCNTTDTKTYLNNYIISHVWGETANPLFFTSLWNVVLVPCHLAFILDKSDTNSEIARKIKVLVKAMCYRLYSPDAIYPNMKNLINTNDFRNGLFPELDKILNEKYVNFIKPFNSVV